MEEVMEIRPLVAAVLEEEASEAEAPEANSNHNQLLYNDVQQHFWKYLPSHQFR